ncbi:MAG: hypothetical protein ACO307_17015, partial [Ilumatobacteraceae bacterium]
MKMKRLVPGRRRREDAEPTEPRPIDLRRSSRPRERDRTTRRPLTAWDRTKYSILLVGLFAFFWWQRLDTNPIKSIADAWWETVEQQAWIVLLVGLEVVRQVHFVVAERWSGYHRFWKQTVFGRFDGRSQRVDPWTRYRIARLLRILFAIAVVAVVTAQVTGD